MGTSSFLRNTLIATVLLTGVANPARPQAAMAEKPRIVVTTDPELDDLNSLIRFLLYSTDFRIEGLVYASSQFHWKGDGKGTKVSVPGREYTRFGLDLCPCESWRWKEGERFIHEAVEAYAKVYPNLKVHHPDYPEPEYLLARIRYGNIEFDGDISQDSPGSELIRALILDEVPGPLYLSAWGGHSTIARALKSIQEDFEGQANWAEIRAKISAKVVLLPSGDQDNTYRDYIKPNWPDMAYWQIENGPNYGYGAQLRASPADSLYLTASWMGENIRNRGPLGELYRVWGDGKQMVEGNIFDFFGFAGVSADTLRARGYVVWMPLQAPGSWLSEGDTGTFMNLLDNGLRAWEDTSFWGWGGRFPSGEPDMNPFGADRAADGGESEKPDYFPPAQRDFANRMHWSVTPEFGNANHPPDIAVEGPRNRLVAPGSWVRIPFTATDPDGHPVTVRARIEAEVPGLLSPLPIQVETGVVRVQIPEDAPDGAVVQLLLEATDKGLPALTRYARVGITIQDY